MYRMYVIKYKYFITLEYLHTWHLQVVNSARMADSENKQPTFKPRYPA